MVQLLSDHVICQQNLLEMTSLSSPLCLLVYFLRFWDDVVMCRAKPLLGSFSWVVKCVDVGLRLLWSNDSSIHCEHCEGSYPSAAHSGLELKITRLGKFATKVSIAFRVRVRVRICFHFHCGVRVRVTSVVQDCVWHSRLVSRVRRTFSEIVQQSFLYCFKYIGLA